MDEYFFVFFLLDPHVRIVGKPNDVKKAKDRILSILDSRVRTFFIQAHSIMFDLF